MPRLSSFYGITIWIYYDENQHPGRPHFHARYAGADASFDIENASLIAGGLPQRAVRLVVEWATKHRAELRDNWNRARERRQLQPIDPLG
jgi:Domain of unknown function (DUF4160)